MLFLYNFELSVHFLSNKIPIEKNFGQGKFIKVILEKFLNLMLYNKRK